MSAWTDALSGTLLANHSYADGVSWNYVGSGLCENRSTTPIAFTSELINEIFAAFGNDLRTVSQTSELPLEFLVAAIALVAELVGTTSAATYVKFLPGFISEEDTPELAYAGSTGLRFDYVRALRGAILIPDYIAVPATAINTAAEHMVAAVGSTMFQPPMVASAYNTDSGVRYDPTSRWRMANEAQTDRYLGWWNATTRVIAMDGTIAGSAPTFTSALQQITPAEPVSPTDAGQQFGKPDSQAAVANGMMTSCEHNPSLSTTWPLDKTTQDRIANVAMASSSGLGLPLGQATFSYPDRGGTMREMTPSEVQNLFIAMRDYLTGIQQYDIGSAQALPGQPVYMP